MDNEKKQQRVFAVGFSLIALVALVFLLKPFFLNWLNDRKNDDEKRINEEILKAPSIVPEELFKKIRSGTKVFLVDISDAGDFKKGHVATSVNAPASGAADRSFFDGIGAGPTADIVIVNQSEDLANLATTVNRLIADGFTNAKYLRGGISGWREKGYPLVSSGGSETDGAKVKKISIEEIKNEAGVNSATLQFLDVRDAESFAKEHIVEAINIPLSGLESRYGEISAAKKIIVYGANENQGFQAAVVLFDLNLFNVYQMQGSIDDWKAAGGNVE